MNAFLELICCNPRVEMDVGNLESIFGSDLPILPIEVIVLIFSYLSARDLLKCLRVCRAWARLTVNEKLFSKKFRLTINAENIERFAIHTGTYYRSNSLRRQREKILTSSMRNYDEISLVTDTSDPNEFNVMRKYLLKYANSLKSVKLYSHNTRDVLSLSHVWEFLNITEFSFQSCYQMSYFFLKQFLKLFT